MLMNIELKGPLDEAWVAQYDYNLAAQKVVELIDSYDIASKTMVSSFVPRILDAIIEASASADQPRKFMIQSLRNRKGVPDPADYSTFEHMTGVNIFYNYLTQERVEKVHSTGSFIGLWYS